MGDEDPMVSGDFTAEDIYACEQQQKSLTSPFFEVGPAANGESPVVMHQKTVLEFLEAQDTSPGQLPAETTLSARLTWEDR